jgi:hypothetical protein
VIVPAKTPKEAVAEITVWLTSALEDPQTRRKLVAQGLFLAVTCGADFGALTRKQYDEYGRVIRALRRSNAASKTRIPKIAVQPIQVAASPVWVKGCSSTLTARPLYLK